MATTDYRKEAETTGICMECFNKTIPNYVICEECAEGLSKIDLLDCLTPTVQADEERREDAFLDALAGELYTR